MYVCGHSIPAKKEHRVTLDLVPQVPDIGIHKLRWVLGEQGRDGGVIMKGIFDITLWRAACVGQGSFRMLSIYRFPLAQHSAVTSYATPRRSCSQIQHLLS